jgi:outer membrane immunogenic protein
MTQLASAADLPVKAPAPPLAATYNWSGFYTGLNAGWGWLRDHGNTFCIDPAGVVNGFGCISNTIPGAQIDGDGFIGGGQIGYNWQVNQWVFGVEADIQGADIKGAVDIIFNTVEGPGRFVAHEKLNWLGTVRGRVGWAWGRLLIYGTGGFAYGGVDVDQNTIFPTVQYPSSVSTTKTGWTAGGGLEWAFYGNWSGKIEGLYYNLASISTVGGAVGDATA